MEDQTLKELKRIRAINRALRAEVELVRSSNDSGLLRLRINESRNFRLIAATAIVKESSPSYNNLGIHYANVVDGINFFVRHDDACDRWHKRDEYKVFKVRDLVDKTANFSPEVDWQLTDIPHYADMRREYLQAVSGNFINQVTNPNDVIEFARNLRQDWAEIIRQIEIKEFNNVVEFILDNFPDEIINDLTKFNRLKD